jgi:acetate kinase
VDHEEAVEQALAQLTTAGVTFECVCHRVVHGGARFTAPTLIDAALVSALDALVELAPLHNAPAVAAIRSVARRLGHDRPAVAVFDTAFHAELPEHARTYAIPRALAERYGIRRYGFPGLAFESVVERYAEAASVTVSQVRVVALHLGGGCSAAAISGGRSIDTSMGFTPLEGLVMATRAGDVDPAIVEFLARKEGVDAADVTRWLQERSGLRGLSDGGGDMRDLLAREADDPLARLAIDVFCYRARKYVGAYLSVLGGADAIVFSGGIGEHQPEIRRRIVETFAWAGLRIDDAANRGAVGDVARISAPDARLAAWVIPADEEAVMARAARDLLDPL